MNLPSLEAAARSLAGRLPSSVLKSLRRVSRAAKMRAEAQTLLAHDPVASRTIYRQLATDHPDHPIHWIGLGLAEAAAGDLDAAAQAAVQARRRVGDRPEAHLALADLEQRLGRTPEALNALLTGLRAVETNAPSASLRFVAVD